MSAPGKRSGGDASEAELLARAVARLNGRILGLVLGAVAAAALFVLTNWLVLKGGDPVGPHLGLLGQYFIGYRVTFAGSFVGAAYAFAAGYLAGRLVGAVYNRVADLRAG